MPPILLIAKIVFCRPKGIGVNLASNTTLKACDPDITLSIALAVSFCIRVPIGNLDDNKLRVTCAIAIPKLADNTTMTIPLNMPNR